MVRLAGAVPVATVWVGSALSYEGMTRMTMRYGMEPPVA